MDWVHWLRRKGLLSSAKGLEWYPPFLCMGVRVLALSDDWRQVRLLLPLNRRTRNPGGSMFGGCMASLADPIAALACSRVFPGYAVWTRAMSLDFRREGRGDLELRFAFDPALEEQIRAQLAQRGRATPSFEYAYYAGDGEACALVLNTVAIRSHHRHESGGALGRGKLPESPPANPGRNRAQPIATDRDRGSTSMSNQEDNLQMDLTSGISAFEAKHFSQASHLLSPLAEAGHPDAQYRMAIMAQNGLGMAPNELMAYKYMRSAAEQGFALAQHGLGFMYLEGECVEKNEAKAVEWFRKAAEQGLVGSQTTLAMLYEEGKGVEKSLEEAQRWYKMAGFDS